MSTHAAPPPILRNNRIVAVDTVRILAALIVMTLHLYRFPVPLAQKYCFVVEHTIGDPSALFFLFAGYFACRNITWKKALNNAWWSLAPFALWNGICIIVWHYHGLIPSDLSWSSLWGMSKLFLKSFAILDASHPGRPLDVPLWFMRDLIFLFLLSPILARLARWLFPVLFLASLVPAWSDIFSHAHYRAVMSPYSLGFFTAGCFLMSFSRDTQRKALTYCNMWIVACFLLIAVIRYRLQGGVAPFWLNVLYAISLYQIARMLEIRVPKVAELSVKYAPITFLTFAVHWIVWPFIPIHRTATALLCPFATFVALGVFFYGLKRWAPCLLHLVAHYKLRPEDIKPKRTETPSASSPAS